MKIPLKTHLNQRTYHNLQSHLTYCYAKMFALITQTICESLVEIQQFRHEKSLIMYENTQIRNKIKGCSITCSHIWHFNTSKCLYWKFDEDIWYQTKLPFICVIFFADLPKKTALKIKNLATLGCSWIKYGIFSKYFRPLHKLVYVVDALQTDNRPNSEITDR